MNPDSLKSSENLQVPSLSKLKKIPKHPLNTQLIHRKGTELSISPPTPNRYRVSYSPTSPNTDMSSKHTRSSTVSPRAFKFIAATATSPFEDFQTPVTDFPTSEISEDLCSSPSLEEEPKHLPVYTSPSSYSQTSYCLAQVGTHEKCLEIKLPLVDVHEKVSTATRLTTGSVEEQRGFDLEYSIGGRKVYCDKCEKNVLTEFLFRNAELSLWEKIWCGVCYQGNKKRFREIVHYCSECRNEVALIRFKQVDE